MTVELPILGVLKDSPRHGYELRQAIDAVLGPFGSVSWGSLYPMLRKLEEKGYLHKRTAPAGKGPERLVYGLTAAGEQRLTDLLADGSASGAAEGFTAFLTKVAFFQHLSPGERQRILDAQAAALQAQLADRVAQKETSVPSDRYGRVLLDYAISRLRADLQWVAWLRRAEA